MSDDNNEIGENISDSDEENEDPLVDAILEDPEKLLDEDESPIKLNKMFDLEELQTEFDLVKDIPVVLTLEVGGRYITIGELLEMKPGEIIPLDREEDESLDVKVNGTLVARGEVVLVENRYGVRLLDIVSPSERLKMIS